MSRAASQLPRSDDWRRSRRGYNLAMEALATVLVLSLAAGQAGGSVEAWLDRLCEEAEVFRHAAPKLIGRETLRQRALQPRPRFRPRIGKEATEPPKPEYRTREIVSEYTFGTLRESPGVLHEFRQVVSVDGRQLRTAEQARRKLVSGMRSADDHLKRRLLEQFERYGLRGAAADFGPLILLFTRRRLAGYSFQQSGRGRVGAEAAVVISFRETPGAESLTIFEGSRAVRVPVEGHLWLRENDGLPLRIALESRRQQDGATVLDQATVDYVMSPHGVLVPASVVRRRLIGDLLVVEDVFQYSSFRMFAADAEIKFP